MENQVNFALAVVGKVIKQEPIANTDHLKLAYIDCAQFGQWRSVINKDLLNEKVLVFLQDAVVPPDSRWQFLERYKWRVKITKFKGMPSECVAIGLTSLGLDANIGDNLTKTLNVTKYVKELPTKIAGNIKGPFPYWLSKTDEVNYQVIPETLKSILAGKYYVMLKYDGTSATAWVDEEGVHVCSRNYEIKEGDNIYWRMVLKYNLYSLPRDHAIQFEIIGPGIQKNPVGVLTNEIRVFNVWKLSTLRIAICYNDRLPYYPYLIFCRQYDLPIPTIIEPDYEPNLETIYELADQNYYESNKIAEGVVIRNHANNESVKVINLNYKD